MSLFFDVEILHIFYSFFTFHANDIVDDAKQLRRGWMIIIKNSVWMDRE
jgi:hypothetical protein